MEGFRFWKQGYWRNHLQGRRYHISALYVVDLKRFRKIAAGDRLRGQYQVSSFVHNPIRCVRRNSGTHFTIIILFTGPQPGSEQFVEFGPGSAQQYDPSSGH